VHWIGGWAESNVGLDGSGVNVLPRRGFELPTVQPIAGSYTDCSMQLVSGRSLTAKARARSRRHFAWDIFSQNFVFPCQYHSDHVHAILNTEPRILQNNNTLDKDLSVSQRSWPTVGPIQIKRLEREVTYLHLVPRLGVSGATPPPPAIYLYGVDRDTFTFTFTMWHNCDLHVIDFSNLVTGNISQQPGVERLDDTWAHSFVGL
jgi:hypothetical protein